jgi:hypothetical protein
MDGHDGRNPHYTHRVGISNQRLVSMDERGVTFRTKDGRAVTVAGHELLARFVEHVLPHRFVKIRHYGLHAASHATTRLEVARGRLTSSAVPRDQGARRGEPLDWRELLLRVSGFDVRVCPVCSQIAVERTALPVARCRAPPRAT